jgi:hypothetical protein
MWFHDADDADDADGNDDGAAAGYGCRDADAEGGE